MFRQAIKGSGFEKRREVMFFCALLLCYITRYAAYGFEYYPLLDDYIQYYWYANMPDTLNSVFLGIGTISTRPLAGISDVYFWTGLFASGGAAVLLSGSLISVLAIYFLRRVLEGMSISVGAVFYAVLLFFPIVFETQYWLSASSRIMVGIFFAALALVMLERHTRHGGGWRLALFWLLNLCSMCFYEQVLIFSFLLCVAYIYRTGQKRSTYIVPCVNVCIVALYYLAFKDVGALGGRTKILLTPEIFSHIEYMINELGNVLADCFVGLNANGFVRGLAVLKDKLWLGLCILVFSAALALLDKRMKKHKRNDWFVYLLSLVLMLAPLALLFITQDAALPYRTVYVSLIGMAILLDRVLSLVPVGERAGRVLVLVCIFCLSVACVSEMTDYRTTSLIDKKICTGIVRELDEKTISGEGECYLVGAKRAYTETNTQRGEHIISVTSSDWALTGAVRYYLGGYVKRIIPAESITDEIIDSGASVLELNDELEVKRLVNLRKGE